MTRRSLVLLILVALGFNMAFVTGCATSRKAGWEQKDAAMKLTPVEQRRLMREGKKYWLSRHQLTDLKEALARFEKVAQSDPDHYEALVLLTRGYYILADGHLEDEKAKMKNWEIGTSWGERAMATNPEFRKKVIEGDTAVEDALDVLTRNEIDAIYWTAVNLGKWGKLSGIATILKYKNRIRRMIERVQELDPDYYYGAPDRYWGVYYAVAPFFAGGSMEKSLEHFKRALTVENGYLATHNLFAEHYAARKGNRELFREEVQFVLDAKTDPLPDVIPEQIIEKRKAERMLKNMEEYF